MKEYTIKSTLKTMILYYDYITICDDFKIVSVQVKDDEFGQRVQRQVELVNPKDYSKLAIISKYDLNTKVIKWIDSYTEDGEPSMIVVLEG